MRPPSAKAKAAVRAMLSHIDSDPLQLRGLVVRVMQRCPLYGPYCRTFCKLRTAREPIVQSDPGQTEMPLSRARVGQRSIDIGVKALEFLFSLSRARVGQRPWAPLPPPPLSSLLPRARGAAIKNISVMQKLKLTVSLS